MSNVGQVEEIEKRALSLSDMLRSPLREGDHSERARRELLCRFVRRQSWSSLPLTLGIYRRLVNVLERLEPLSERNGLLRFLQNEDHAGLLNSLVQDVAQAVTDYKVRGPKRTVRRY